MSHPGGKHRSEATRPALAPVPVQRVPGAVSHRGGDAAAKPKRERVVLGGGSDTAAPLPSRIALTRQTGWGEILIKDLIGVQLRVGLLVSLGCVVVLAALPLLFWLVPGLEAWPAAVVWIVFGLVPLGLLVVVGVAYHRVAERQERAFVDMVE